MLAFPVPADVRLRYTPTVGDAILVAPSLTTILSCLPVPTICTEAVVGTGR